MSKYSYQEGRTPEVNMAMALYAIATELSNLGMKDAADRRGALEMLSEEVRGVKDSLGYIAEALCQKDGAGSLGG